MTSANNRAFLILVAIASGCSSQTAGSGLASTGGPGSGNQSSTNSGDQPLVPNPTVGGAANAIPITANGDGTICGPTTANYNNQECVTLTICVPGTSTCQQLTNVLLDTGSTGLRVLKSALNSNMNLEPVVSVFGGGTLAECEGYLSGESDWGPVALADIQLGTEPFAKSVPIQLIESGYATPQSPCAPPEATLANTVNDTGWQAILGVSNMSPVEDCGVGCVSVADNGMYFTCNSGGSCAPSTASLGQQVANPVALMPVDNNGVVISFPSVTAGGMTSLQGTLTFGIGTEANNTPPAGVNAIPINVTLGGMGIFINTELAYVGATPIFGFLDSGSSTMSLPGGISGAPTACTEAGLTSCFCNSSDTGYPGATYIADENGSVTPQDDDGFDYDIHGTLGTAVPFTLTVGSMVTALESPNSVFSDVACSNGVGGGSTFDGLTQFTDLGLPFFYGKTVYTAFEGASTSLGTGPYWAY